MKVFNLLDNYDINNCSVENEFGWFWCLEERYIPRRMHGGCHRVYTIFRVRLKKNNEEMFVAYNSEGEPIIDSKSFENLMVKVDIYDFARRYQGL